MDSAALNNCIVKKEEGTVVPSQKCCDTALHQVVNLYVDLVNKCAGYNSKYLSPCKLEFSSTNFGIIYLKFAKLKDLRSSQEWFFGTNAEWAIIIHFDGKSESTIIPKVQLCHRYYKDEDYCPMAYYTNVPKDKFFFQRDFPKRFMEATNRISRAWTKHNNNQTMDEASRFTSILIEWGKEDEDLRNE